MCAKFVWNYRFFVCQSHRPVNKATPTKSRITNNPVFDASMSSNDCSKCESISSNQTLISPKVSESEPNSERDYAHYSVPERREISTLLTLIFMLSFICYGVLPGLQPYSTLPYGNDIYNYAVNLSKAVVMIWKRQLGMHCKKKASKTLANASQKNKTPGNAS